MARVGVVLSGCGFQDGSEIHEATLTLLYLDRAGVEIVCMSADIKQKIVVNHLTKEAQNEQREVIVESARIARGNIKHIKDVSVGDIDALIFPGGYGAAKNLCDFADCGPDCSVNPEVEKLILAMHETKKPIGFICIAPAIAAKVLGKFNPQLTIGSDQATASALLKMGARHKECKVDEIAVDSTNKIVSTPAYMLGPTISQIALGIEKLVAKVLELAT